MLLLSSELVESHSFIYFFCVMSSPDAFSSKDESEPPKPNMGEGLQESSRLWTLADPGGQKNQQMMGKETEPPNEGSSGVQSKKAGPLF